MAASTTEHHQLSAEAAVFVPTNDSMSAGHSSLPKYIYNCYPFVQEPTSKHNVHHNRSTTKSGLHNNGTRKQAAYLPSHSASYQMSGSYCPQHPHRQGGLFNQNGYHINPSGYFSPRNPSPGPVVAPYHGFGMYVPPSTHSPALHHGLQGSLPTSFTDNSTYYNGNGNQDITLHRKQQNQTGRKSKVSVGTQNEPKSKKTSSSKSAANAKPMSRTIILVHAAAQTDFSSEIANHTLEQMPNALYQGKRKTRRKAISVRQQQGGGGDTTDSEELDHSDSGYSSPLHRQNQISSGTDARSRNCDVQSYSNINNNIQNEIISQQSPSYTATQAGSTGLFHAAALHADHGQLGLLSQNSMSYASAVATSHQHRFNGNRVCPTGSTLQTSNISTPSTQFPAQLNNGALSDGGQGEKPADGQKKKRKRGRRRRKKGVLNQELDVNAESKSSALLHSAEIDCHSPILSQEAQINILTPENLIDNFPSFSEAGLYDDLTECKLSGKRKKRRELANKAALEEQLEIDLEQQALKVVNQTPAIIKPTNSTSAVRKSQQLVSVNLMDLVKPTVYQDRKSDSDSMTINSLKVSSNSLSSALNPLDSSAPSIKRGKERETPKAKKPSALKKVILKEREEKKRQRYIGEGPVDIISTPDSSLHFTSEPEENDEDDIVISDLEDNVGDCDLCTPQTQDLSPVSQNSPISVGLLSPPTTYSNPASGVASPTVVSDIIQKIHSRRFREYCNQVLDKDIDAVCTNLLQTLVKFQDRLYHKDPIKAKTKRRLVLGLREVTKHLKLCRVKLVIISPNLEKIQSKGGLDDALNMITSLCTEQDVPFVFALGRRSLGRACAKLVPVSVVGVFNYQGAEAMYNELMELTVQARADYHQMVDALAKEVAEYGGILKGSSGLYFSHLGHSRTPSGCSAVSFTSSILSEPIPDQKPEVHTKSITNQSEMSLPNNTQGSAASSVSESRAPLQDDMYDIDEGNEADTEDNDGNNPHIISEGKLKDESKLNSVCVNGTNNKNLINEMNMDTILNNNNNRQNDDKCHSVQGNSVESVTQTISQLSLKKLLTEAEKKMNCISHHDVKSQASSHTIDLQDTTSNQSSMTVEDLAEDGHVSDHLASSSSSTKLDRIKSWVRDIDPSNTKPAKISQDDVEFNATLTACEANTEVLISRSRSSSLTQTAITSS